ncbi:hypothetical protein HDU76_001929 [Blyttiomyces sp. JEL0837]|nr:hypothetical protein HDU76_001929 [Blyttiomyces sp. JEL0837]
MNESPDGRSDNEQSASENASSEYASNPLPPQFRRRMSATAATGLLEPPPSAPESIPRLRRAKSTKERAGANAMDFNSGPVVIDRIGDPGLAGSTYVERVFEQFQETALAANRPEFVHNEIPLDAEILVAHEANFFFEKTNESEEISPQVSLKSLQDGGPKKMTTLERGKSGKRRVSEVKWDTTAAQPIPHRKRASSANQHITKNTDAMIPQGTATEYEIVDEMSIFSRWWRVFMFWVHENFLWDFYPKNSTPESRLMIYFERRELPKYRPTLIELVAVGVAAVITGEFSGWNGALSYGGLGGLIAATWIAAVMYLCLSLCLAEMSVSIPVVGGGFAYSRIATSDYPMLQVAVDYFGPEVRRYSLFWLFPAFTVNAASIAWASARQTWALSRAGFLPQFLSLTHPKTQVPWRATLFCSVYAYVMAFVAVYIKGFNQDLDAVDVLLNLTIISAVMNYVGVGIVFLAFRYRHPKAPRPFRSPLGVGGGYLLLFLSALIIAEQVLLSPVFQITLATYAVKMIASGSYFILKGRLHLLPTEDALIYSFWTQNNKPSKLSRSPSIRSAKSKTSIKASRNINGSDSSGEDSAVVPSTGPQILRSMSRPMNEGERRPTFKVTQSTGRWWEETFHREIGTSRFELK